MSTEHERVMDKLIARCRQAYQAQKPLIMVDTEDIDLMDRLARESQLVDLFELTERAYDQRYLKF